MNLWNIYILFAIRRNFEKTETIEDWAAIDQELLW